MKFITGIDPGWGGGIALISDAADVAASYSFAGQTETTIIDEVNICVSSADVCYIEKVHSMPKQGVASSFKFGWIYGLLRALVVGKVRTVEVTPQAWQKALGCSTHGDKNISKAAAERLFPKELITHGNADALLISYYGSLMERGAKIDVKKGKG